MATGQDQGWKPSGAAIRHLAGQAPPPPAPRDPGDRHPDDFKKTLVLGRPPTRASGVELEVTFTPHAGRHVLGVLRTPQGRRVTVEVDPALDPRAYVVEEALTGAVIDRGFVAGKLSGGI